MKSKSKLSAKSTTGTKDSGTKGENILRPIGTSIKKFKDFLMVFLLTQFGEGVQKSGRAGGVVIMKNGRQRQFRAPAIQHTLATGRVRTLLGSLSTAFTNLAQDVQNAWNAGKFTTVDRLSRIQTLSGRSAFIKLNANLTNSGQSLLTTPPSSMEKTALLTNPVLTADSTAHTLSLAYTPVPDSPMEALVFATSQRKLSIFKPRNFKLIGAFDQNHTSPLNLKTQYDAVFGVDSVNTADTKIFIEIVPIAGTGNAGSKVRIVTVVI